MALFLCPEDPVTEEEIEAAALELDQDPIPGLGDPPADDEDEDEVTE